MIKELVVEDLIDVLRLLSKNILIEITRIGNVPKILNFIINLYPSIN